MQRLWEIILGLNKGFLAGEGRFSLRFHPSFPGQEWVGAGLYNVLLIAASIALVVYVYRQAGGARSWRWAAAGLRLMLFLLLIAALNQPVIHLQQNREQPSVLAVMIDDSQSMQVADQPVAGVEQPRLDAVKYLLTDPSSALLASLGRDHELRLYHFGSQALPLALQQTVSADQNQTGRRAGDWSEIKNLTAQSTRTQITASIKTVLQDLQGQSLAGVVLLSDGRQIPAAARHDDAGNRNDWQTKIFAVPVGSTQTPRNIEVGSINLQESAFKGDVVNLRVHVRASGFPAGQLLPLRLVDEQTDAPLTGADGQSVQQMFAAGDGQWQEVELPFRADRAGVLNLAVQAQAQPGEIDTEDNARSARIDVLEGQINVLAVDGYPRWDFRYLRTQMMREPTVNISALLLSADPAALQESDRPINRFPETIQEMLEYDVVLIGDVDPRYFSDQQLELMRDFVANRGGGLAMVAGPYYAPGQYRDTAVAAILPVRIDQVSTDNGQPITSGFRPIVTALGQQSSIFRFFTDRQRNQQFLDQQWPPIFWYQKGISVKPGAGEVYAQHPSEIGPDGHPAPLLVLGRYGAGRTLFSAIDDSWRWRFYTGESIFNTYWIQQFRYLARGRKLGQRKLVFSASQPMYELGQQIQLTLRVLDPVMSQQLPQQLPVEIVDDQGQVVRREMLQRQQNQDEYRAAWIADGNGRFRAHLNQVLPQTTAMNLPIQVLTPRLELQQSQVDRSFLNELARRSGGAVVEFNDAARSLPQLIHSAALNISLESEQPIGSAPLVMILFAVLITAEWVIRKKLRMV